MNINCLAPAHGGKRSTPSPDNVGSSSSGDGDGGRRDAIAFSTAYDVSFPFVGIHSLFTVLNRPSRKTFSVSLAGAGALIPSASGLEVGVNSPSKELPPKPMPSGSNESSIESSRGIPLYACARCSSVKKCWSMPGLSGAVADGYSSHVEEDGVGPASR